MASRFADHFISDTHANRPDANTVPTGTLFACSDHTKVYQSDGSSWSDWHDGSGAGGGSSPVENTWAATLQAVTTNPTLGSGGSFDARYWTLGRLVRIWGRIKFGSSGANAGSGTYFFDLPFEASTDLEAALGFHDGSCIGSCHMRDDSDAGVGGRVGTVQLRSSTVACFAIDNAVVNEASPHGWGNSDTLAFEAEYLTDAG